MRGAILGGAIGDALGAPIEFMSPQAIRQVHPHGFRELSGGGMWKPGETTDDSALMLATAAGYLDGKGFDPDRAAEAAVAWLNTGPKDVGIQTSRVLSMIRQGASVDRAAKDHQKVNPQAAGNGSLMRCSPTGIVRRQTDSRLMVESRISSEITHADARCVGACIAYNTALATLLDAGSVGFALKNAAESAAPGVVADLVMGVIHHDRPRYHSEGIGYVLLSLERAFIALRDAESFEEALVDVANQGGDSDTNAAIAGGLLGARFGADAIPERWINGLRDRARFEAVAADLARQGA